MQIHPKPSVAVIGAGITGSVTALHLSEQGYNVTLLEKGAGPGHGASSRSAACFRQQFSTETTVRGMVYAVKYFAAFANKYRLPTNSVRQIGYLYLFTDKEKFAEACRDNANQRRLWGVKDAVVLSVQDVARKFPYVRTEGLLGATWCPSDGYLDPSQIYMTAVERVKEVHGGTVVLNAEVTGAVKHGDRIIALITSKGKFQADYVVNATNAWTPRFNVAVGATPLPIDPKKRFLGFLKTGEVNVEGRPFIIAPTGAYCRPQNSHEYVMGWAHETEPEYDFSDEDQDRIPESFRPRNVDGGIVAMQKSLATVIPDMGEMGAFASTAGYYDVTPDACPFIDVDPLVPNLIHATGFSGHGVMHSPFTAVIVRHLIENGRSRLNGASFVMELEGQMIDLSSFAIGRCYRQEGNVL